MAVGDNAIQEKDKRLGIQNAAVVHSACKRHLGEAMGKQQVDTDTDTIFGGITLCMNKDSAHTTMCACIHACMHRNSPLIG